MGKYRAVQATASQDFFNYRTNKNIVQDIEAWFVPEIPVPFGPQGYEGLPGLIIELRVAGRHYLAKDISLGPITEEIRKPVEGKVVSFEEYQALSAGLSEKFREFVGHQDP